MATKIELGQRYRDEVTGFEGIATARYEYLFACERVHLTGDVQFDGSIKDIVCDVPSVVKVDGRTYTPDVMASARTGGDRPSGARPSAPAR